MLVKGATGDAKGVVSSMISLGSDYFNDVKSFPPQINMFTMNFYMYFELN